MKISQHRLLHIIVLTVTLALALSYAVDRVTAADVPPILDLNGEAEGINYSATFTEDEGAEAIVSVAGLTISNGEDNVLTSARAVLTNRPDGPLESLLAEPGTTGLVVSYKGDTGELTVKGNGSVEDYQQVLRTLAYNNTSQSPDITDRVVTITVSDGNMVSAAAVSTIAINAVNDAPVLDNTGDMTMTPLKEDELTSQGNAVSTIIKSAETAGEDRITDVDRNSREGFAVIEASSANGQWQYSVNAGISWLPFGAVSNTSAVLLNEEARIRFVPLPHFNGSANFMFRAWDQSGGRVNGAAGVDVSQNGGITPFSVASDMVTINIVAVNDPPDVDLNGSGTGKDFSDTFFENGSPTPIADPMATIVDVDHSSLSKLTVTLTNRPDGAVETLAATGSGSITVAPYDPITGILTVTGPDTIENFQQVLRQITYNNMASSATSGARLITVVANDGQNDSAVVTATITVNPPNNAPVLDSAATITLADIPEDAAQPTGELISAILAKGGDPITDVDNDALEGIAIVGAETANGQWQYSTLNPPIGSESWKQVGVVSNTAALLLSDASWLRFVPAANYNGQSGALTFRAWDRTSGSNGQQGANTSTNGGNTPYSVETNAISVFVSPANDLPVLGGIPATPLLYVEDAGPLPLPGNSLTVTDIDSPLLASATVRLTNPMDGDAEWLLVTTESTGINQIYEGGVLQLTGAAAPAVYQTVLRSLKYWNASQDPDPTDRVFRISVADNQGSSAPATLVVQVQPVNDPPELDLNGIGPGENFVTTFYINRGPVPIVAESLVVNDIDNTTLVSATVRIANVKNSGAEILSADLTGVTNIKTTYNSISGELALVGVDSIANYQRVLRTLTYDNTLPTPDRTPRTIEFKVSDAAGSTSLVQHTTLSVAPAPSVRLFAPVVTWAYRRAEEPNDTCAEAMGIGINVNESFLPDDISDWFFFDLAGSATTTVGLRNFIPKEGQIIVTKGCSSEDIIANNGSDETDKVVNLGRRAAGRYYIWVINDGPLSTTTPYELHVRVVP